MLHHTQLPQSFHTALSILTSAFFSYVKYASEASLLILTSWFVPHSLHYEHLALISLIRVQNKFTQKLFQLCWSCLCNLQTSRSFQILAFYSKHLHLFFFFFNYSLGSRDEQNLGRVWANKTAKAPTMRGYFCNMVQDSPVVSFTYGLHVHDRSSLAYKFQLSGAILLLFSFLFFFFFAINTLQYWDSLLLNV